MIRILIASLCIISPAYASAEIIISEIMYDLPEGSDTGREWIEVYNDGESVNLTEYYVLENGKERGITTNGEAILPAGAYAVVADNAEKFAADWPEFRGALYDGSFRLNNTGEALSIIDPGGAASELVTYAKSLGGNGTGESLQRSGDGFAPGSPTPGRGADAQLAAPKDAGPAAPHPVEPASGSEISREASAHTASAAPAAAPLWWFAPLFLAIVASSGIVWSRRLKSGEWEILEEDGEKS
jgi:hypothetical protein